MKFKGQRERQKEYLKKKKSIDAIHKRLKENPITNARLYEDLEEIWKK